MKIPSNIICPTFHAYNTFTTSPRVSSDSKMCIGNLWTALYDCIANLRDGGVVGEPGGVAAGAGALVGARGAALVRDLGGHLYHDT